MRNGYLVSLINTEHFSGLSDLEQSNLINSAFLEPLEVYRLQELLPHLPLEDTPEFLSVTEERVKKVLSNLSISIASGPDNVPNWLLKEYSHILALPITYISRAAVARHLEDGRHFPSSKKERRA